MDQWILAVVASPRCYELDRPGFKAAHLVILHREVGPRSDGSTLRSLLCSFTDVSKTLLSVPNNPPGLQIAQVRSERRPPHGQRAFY